MYLQNLMPAKCLIVQADTMDLEILSGKHAWLNKRLAGYFTATIKDALQIALHVRRQQHNSLMPLMLLGLRLW